MGKRKLRTIQKVKYLSTYLGYVSSLKANCQLRLDGHKTNKQTYEKVPWIQFCLVSLLVFPF